MPFRPGSIPLKALVYAFSPSRGKIYVERECARVRATVRKYLDRTFAVVLAAGLVFNSSTDVFGTSLVTPPTFNQSASIFTGQALAARPTSIPIHLAGDALCQVVQLLEAFWNILPGYSRFAHSTHMSFFGVPPLPPKEESPTFYRVAESGEVHFIYARHDT